MTKNEIMRFVKLSVAMCNIKQDPLMLGYKTVIINVRKYREVQVNIYFIRDKDSIMFTYFQIYSKHLDDHLLKHVIERDIEGAHRYVIKELWKPNPDVWTIGHFQLDRRRKGTFSNVGCQETI